jgi:TIR domain
VNDIFLSYAREDQERAKKLAKALGAQGWTVFWDRTIQAGQTWRGTIDRSLQATRCVVVAWSKYSIESNWVCEEAEEGKERKILVPILFDDVKPPMGFRSIQAGSLVNWDGKVSSDAFRQLVFAIEYIIGSTKVPPNPPQPVQELEAKAKPKASLYLTWLSNRRHLLLILVVSVALAMMAGWFVIDLKKQQKQLLTESPLEKPDGKQSVLSTETNTGSVNSQQKVSTQLKFSPKQAKDLAAEGKGEAKEKISSPEQTQQPVKSGKKGAANSELAHEAPSDVLFPLYGITLGKTTVAEIQKIGHKKATGINSSTGKPYNFFHINGMDFWYNESSNIVNFIYLTYTDTLPNRWQKLGFDWEKSYTQWVGLLERLGYLIKVIDQPKNVEYGGHSSFSAKIEAYPREMTAARIELGFNYSEGTTVDSKNTLYSISLRGGKPSSPQKR